jgi:hypothetical protein
VASRLEHTRPRQDDSLWLNGSTLTRAAEATAVSTAVEINSAIAPRLKACEAEERVRGEIRGA